MASNRVSVSNYLVANLNLLRFLVGFFAVNFCLFVSRCFVFAPFKNIDGSSPNFWVMLARANGICLNFNSMMLLIFVLRYTLTIMRKIGLVRILPLDHHILLHKKTGIIIFCQAWFHGIMHFVNFGAFLNIHFWTIIVRFDFIKINCYFFPQP